MKIDKITNLILVLVFISSIIITGIYFNYGIEEDSQSESSIDIPKNTNEISDVFNPHGYSIYFGGNSYIAYFFDGKILWNESKEVILKSIITEEPLVMNLNEKEVLLSKPHILYTFDYRMNLDFIRSVSGVSLKSDEIFFSEILFNIEDKRLYFIDDNQMYSLDYENTIELLDAMSDLNQMDHVNFDALENILSSDETFVVSNMTLIPTDIIKNIPSYTGKKYFNSRYDSSMQGILEKLFGNDISFFKKMIAFDESRIYMDGYGDIILTFGFDGSLEFIRKIESDNVFMDLKTALDSAIAFMNYIEEGSFEFNLVDYELKDRKYIFEFETLLDGSRTLTQDGFNKVKIEVENNEVVFYKSFLMNMTQVAIDGEGKSFLEIMGLVLEDILHHSFADDETLDFNEVINNIESYEFLYYPTTDEEGTFTLLPAIVLTIKNEQYIIHMYTGEIL